MAKKLSKREKTIKDTEGLINLDLPVPREAIAFYNKHVKNSIGSGFEYAEYITVRNGKLLQRIFCFQTNGYMRKSSFQECGRRYEGGSLLLSNMGGGYYMEPLRPNQYYSGEDMHKSGWVPSSCYTIQPSKTYISRPRICLNEEKWLKKYPYCAYDKYVGSQSLFGYLCTYRNEKKVELLVKAGYSRYVSSLNSLNIKGKTFKDIFMVNQPFAEEYLKRSGNVRELYILRKNEWIDSEQLLDRYKSFLSDKRYYSGLKELTNKEVEYLILNNVRPNDYLDYIRNAKQLGYPLEQKKYHYPTNFKKMHDKAAKEYTVVKNKKNDEKIARISEACKSLSYEKDGYMIFPVKSADELIKESESLNHCVRTFVEKVADEKSLIMFVRKSNKPNKPFVTLELIKSSDNSNIPLCEQFNRIFQARGHDNSDPDEDTKQFIRDWKQHFNLLGYTA